MSSRLGSLALGFAAILSLGISGSLILAENGNAQVRNSATAVSGGSYYHTKRVRSYHRYRNHSKHLKVRRNHHVSTGVRRSGTRLSTGNTYHRNKVIYVKPRRSTLADRTRRFQLDQAINRQVRPNNRVRVRNGFYYSEVERGLKPNTSACPAGHNCGYRVYEDRSGPRIIVPGISGAGLPPQDGLRGPRIIRVQ